jgi:phospholipid/cholesterol/gamma-HCH transport system substrate-binding protein
MQNKAHALAAGIFVLLVAALAVAMALWLTREVGLRNEFELATKEGVTGLREQAAVRYRGVAVGKVLSIGLDPVARGNVLVRISVDEATPVTKSTFATLGYQGVTGSTFVQLEDNGESAELLHPTDGQVIRIPLKPGLIGALADRGSALLGQVELTTRRLNELLAPENQKRLFETVDRIGVAAQGIQKQGDSIQAQLQATLTQRLNPALAAVPPLGEEATRTLKSLQAATTELSKTAADISRTSVGVARTVDEFGLVARRLTEKGGTLDQLGQSSESVGQASARFSGTSLPSALQATEDTSRAARQMGRAARNLGENPQQLLFGAGAPAPGPGEPGFTVPGARK